MPRDAVACTSCGFCARAFLSGYAGKPMDNQIATLAHQIGVTRLAVQTGLDRVGYPVVAAIRPLSRNLSVSFGKGDTLEQAKLSALMEAAELHVSEVPPQRLQYAAFSELPPGTALDPRLFCNHEAGSNICAQSMHWLSGHDLLIGKPVLAPWQTTSMDFTCEARRQERQLNFGATGLAAGFDEDQAIVHGLCEVVERDSHDAWNNSSDAFKLSTLVNLESVTSPRICKLLQLIANAQLSLLLWDMTGDADIPCFLAEVVDLAAEANTAFAQGAAAHLCGETAIGKAIAEALQVRLTYIAGSRDDLDWSDYGDRYRATVENRRWLLNANLGRRNIADVVETALPARQQRDDITRRMAYAGAEHLVVLRLTPASSPIVVVKVIASHMQDIPDADQFAPASATEMAAVP